MAETYGKKLVKLFEEWCNDEKISHSNFNLIVFLCNKGLVNIEKAIKFVDEETMMPVLTIDEKIILQNIDTKNFYIIGRKNGYLYLKGDECYGFEDGKDKEIFWYLFHNLFTTIEEGKEYKISELLESEVNKDE